MKPNHETIYLVPTDYDGGQLTYSWCDCPAPGEGMDPADAIKYVRADLVPASNEVLANSIAELTRKNSELQADIENILNGDLTPEQYHRLMQSDFFANVKAHAINKHTQSLVESIMAVPVPAENEYANTRMRDVLVNVINHANQLRQQAKAGA